MNKFMISDLHLMHKNIIKFTDNSNGNPDKLIRTKADGTGFESVEEMTEYQVERWNSVVGPKDRVYVLGDIAFPEAGWDIMSRLNGEKEGVLGNHDRHQSKYAEHLTKIHGAIDFGDAVATHIPVHTSQLEWRWKANIHGHLHQNVVRRTDFPDQPDSRYMNVSVERCDFTPIALDDIIAEFRRRGIQINDLKARN